MTTLDIVIPSYNREELLNRTLHSILRAVVPQDLDVGVIVVDNNSTDDTKGVVRDFARFDRRFRYIFEQNQGRSSAINAGIRASVADLIGTVDDDEEIDANWLTEVAANFQDASLDFLGGPCLPNWGNLRCPAWLPESHRGLIGWIVPSDTPFEYGKERHASLVGGNSVVRRCLFDKVGLYHTSLGRTGTGANGGEDLEIYQRFIAAGGKGRYSPKLIIYHHIPAERLKRRFFRKRSFWDGVSIGFISRSRPEPVPQIGGIPRYFVRKTIGDFVTRRDFAAGLRMIELFGRVHGRFIKQ